VGLRHSSGASGAPKVVKLVDNNNPPLKPEIILQEMNSLIGLNDVKNLISEIHAYALIQKKREKERLCADPLALHMIFKGNPGTGKTTMARILAKLFKAMGVLSKGHLVEVERADLVGEYIGHTAQKTREQVRRAQGGILFIDEAYSLARGGEKDFGKESIDVLVRNMELNYQDTILILAGYNQEMEWFLRCNPGLRSRFPNIIAFPDYTITELIQIGELMLKKRQYTLTFEAKEKLRLILDEYIRRGNAIEGNARLVRNIVEKAIRKQATRLVKRSRLTRQELMTLVPEDLA
jgi:stage V sporulation protein K